jgi:hypothetical protein
VRKKIKAKYVFLLVTVKLPKNRTKTDDILIIHANSMFVQGGGVQKCCVMYGKIAYIC